MLPGLLIYLVRYWHKPREIWVDHTGERSGNVFSFIWGIWFKLIAYTSSLDVQIWKCGLWTSIWESCTGEHWSFRNVWAHLGRENGLRRRGYCFGLNLKELPTLVRWKNKENRLKAMAMGVGKGSVVPVEGYPFMISFPNTLRDRCSTSFP